VDSWRAVFTTDVVVILDMAVSTAGADPMTVPPLEGIDNFVPMVMGGRIKSLHLRRTILKVTGGS
jgi:hypothetical protein